MNRINTQELAFLAVEARGQPMHIGFILRFRLPPHASRGALQKLHDEMARWPVDQAPFNQKLRSSEGVDRLKPSWESAEPVELDYHLRHAALPWPGGEGEFGELIARLHSTPLDLTRPLWEMYLIEGLQPAHFAIYLKIHHTLADGVALMEIVSRGLATTPGGQWRPPWTAPAHNATLPASNEDRMAVWARFLEGLMQREGDAEAKEKPAAHIPRGPACLLNGSSSRRRRFATQKLPIARLKAIGQAANATLNDVLLAVCAGALREYLQEFDKVPREPLLASIPVALPRAAGQVAGNSVGAIHVPIATQIADPRRRLLAIRDAVSGAKEDFRRMPPELNRAVSAVGMLVMALLPTAKPAESGKPFTNLTISNLPGPRERLYLAGAELEAMYPVSVLPNDHRLNITVLGYRDHLHFGLIGCPDGLPSLQKIAVALPRALRELELAMQAAPVATTTARRRKPKPSQQTR